jgi:hypothetical protein
MSEKFKQPWAYVGMSVLWFAERGGNNPPSAAIVTEVHDQTLCLLIFDSSTLGGSPKSGVRHTADPNLRMHIDNDAGCWDYNEYDKWTRLKDYQTITAEIESARLAEIAARNKPAEKRAA